MIRKLEKADIPACVEVFQKKFTEYSRDVEKEMLAQFKNNIFDLEFYLFEEDTIIKWVASRSNCMFDDSVYGLISCYVLPEFQGKWIGSRLTEFALKRIKELWGEVVFTTTKETEFFHKFGFEVIKSPYDDRRIMQLIL